MNNNDLICIDDNYSTTKLLSKEKPIIENNPEDKLETILFLTEGENRKGKGGLRTKGYFKKSHEGKPLISIVTVVFNGEKYLEETIQSVINQTYDNVEYIIVDGGSTDRTLDIIKQYEDQIDYWVSEKDNGVYDAMNKGIDLVSGVWINFMNAGDSFYNKNILSKMFENNFYKIDILYGDYQEIYPSGIKKLAKPKSLSHTNQGMPVCHQSCFVKALYHKKNKFSLLYSVSCDFEFIYNAYQKKASFKYVDMIVSNYLIGGMSAQNSMNAKIQDWLIVEKNTKNNLYHVWKLFKKVIKQSIQEKIKYKHPAEQKNALQNVLSYMIEKMKSER